VKVHASFSAHGDGVETRIALKIRYMPCHFLKELSSFNKATTSKGTFFLDIYHLLKIEIFPEKCIGV
jgi:hypothetical protein